MNPDYKSFSDRFTENAKKSLENADIAAQTMSSGYVGTEHILLGILQQEGSIGSKILRNSGVSLENLQLALNFSPNILTTSGRKGLSETAKNILTLSLRLAREFGQPYSGRSEERR